MASIFSLNERLFERRTASIVSHAMCMIHFLPVYIFLHKINNGVYNFMKLHLNIIFQSLKLKANMNQFLKVTKLGLCTAVDESFIFTKIIKQVRKGFRPPSAMKGIGYFQNLEMFLKFFGYFWSFLGTFKEDFLGGILWEKFFGRIFSGGIT